MSTLIFAGKNNDEYSIIYELMIHNGIAYIVPVWNYVQQLHRR